MELLILLDNDGHGHALERNVSNLRKVLRYLDDAGMLESPIGNWIDDPELSIDKIEEFMEENAPMDRSGGGRLYFVDSEPDYKGYNPFI